MLKVCMAESITHNAESLEPKAFCFLLSALRLVFNPISIQKFCPVDGSKRLKCRYEIYPLNAKIS